MFPDFSQVKHVHMLLGSMIILFPERLKIKGSQAGLVILVVEVSGERHFLFTSITTEI